MRVRDREIERSTIYIKLKLQILYIIKILAISNSSYAVTD